MKHVQETDFPSRLKHETFSTRFGDRWREIKGECRESHSMHNIWFMQWESKTFLTGGGGGVERVGKMIIKRWVERAGAEWGLLLVS